jgi:hypothetical protein
MHRSDSRSDSRFATKRQIKVADGAGKPISQMVVVGYDRCNEGRPYTRRQRAHILGLTVRSSSAGALFCWIPLVATSFRFNLNSGTVSDILRGPANTVRMNILVTVTGIRGGGRATLEAFSNPAWINCGVWHASRGHRARVARR